MKNDHDDTIHHNLNAQLKKAYLSCTLTIVLFSIYIECQLLKYIISQFDQFEPPSDYQPSTSILLLINH